MFEPDKHDIEEWLRLEEQNLLRKVCNLYVGGILTEQYKTRIRIVPFGNPILIGSGRGKVFPNQSSAASLYRSFSYDINGKLVGSVPEMREWTQACEDIANGGSDEIPLPPGIGIPLGLQVAASKYEADNINALIGGGVATVISKQLLPDEAIYLRHVVASGNNQAKFQVKVDGSPLQTKRTWFGDFDKDFWFNTANGGILYENEELITLEATNCSDDDGDFEGSIGFVVKEVP